MSSTELKTRPRPSRHAELDTFAHEEVVQSDSPEPDSSTATKTALRPKMVDSKSRIIWPYIIAITLFHLLIPLAFLSYVFSWWGVVWLPIGNYIFCSMGIGAGYHRLLTHRGFKCPLWFEHLLAILASAICRSRPPAGWSSIGSIISIRTINPIRTRRR